MHMSPVVCSTMVWLPIIFFIIYFLKRWRATTIVDKLVITMYVCMYVYMHIIGSMYNTAEIFVTIFKEIVHTIYNICICC